MKVRLGIIIVSLLAVWGCSQGVKPEEKQSYTFTFKNEWVNVELTNRLKGVYIGGGFNGWKYKASPLAYSNGVWTTVFPLSAGEYLYKFVCVFDGMWEDQWIHDFDNPNIRINEFGNYNSALVIKKDGSISPVKVYNEKVTEHFRFFYRPDDFKTNSIDDYIAEAVKNTERLREFLKIKYPKQKFIVYLEGKPGWSWDLNAFNTAILYFAPHNQSVLIHELTHGFLFSFDNNKAMNEGLARYTEYFLNPYDKTGTYDAIPLFLYTLCLLKIGNTNTVSYYMSHPKEFEWLQSYTFASYNFMASFIEYLNVKYGIESVVKLFGNNFDFQAVYKKSIADLDKEWKIWLNAKKISVDDQLIIDWQTVFLKYVYFYRSLDKKGKDVLEQKAKTLGYVYPNEFMKMIVNKNNSAVIPDKKAFKDKLAKLELAIAELMQK